MSILLPTVLIGILGVAFGYMLAWFAQKFAIHTNPLIKRSRRFYLVPIVVPVDILVVLD